MAAQTSPAQHVVCQFPDSARFSLNNRYLGEIIQWSRLAEMVPDEIDFFLQGEMQGLPNVIGLIRMADAAGFLHGIWMSRFGDQPRMGCLFLSRVLFPTVADRTVKIMVIIICKITMAGLATLRLRLHYLGCRFLGLLFFRFLRSPASGEKKQQAKEKNEFDLHNLDTVP